MTPDARRFATWSLAAIAVASIVPLSITDGQARDAAEVTRSDVVIVGAGISGLAAAIEAGKTGASVTVLDIWSVFGGHAVIFSGSFRVAVTDWCF